MRLILFIASVAVLLMPLSGVRAEEGGKAFDAHATSFSYFFKDADMDFHFGNLILGSAKNGGVEIGEAFYAASQIKDGDAASWQSAWYELAGRVEARGAKALKDGHTVSARDQLLRAAYYYRISLLAMQADNPEMEKRGLKCRSLMKQAGALFDPPLEYFEIPFEDTVLPGFFRKADNSGKPAKTLLMIGGGETYIEDLFFYIAPQSHDRGYNFMTVDLPGQGMLPHSGHVFRTDTNVPMKAVVDYALSRPEVDPDKFAAYGFSGGGLFIPQAAMHDSRFKAIAMSSAVVDAHALFATMPAAFASQKEMQSWTPFHAGVVSSICWRYGVDKPSQLIEANRGNVFDSTKIAAPALLLMGEGEYRSKEVQRQQKIALVGFRDPRSTIIVTPSDEGATNHCLMENRSMVGLVLFDWLDTVFQ
ncbi:MULTISPECIES: alpha/beta hydrolase [unclassified Pseudodesulfovibrio]|uniref:alpha/beta hydrolase family protein n=1 Tax=unclassified Pseudodesulfovibrio TaxID=2661612 RepID=UPI000FEC1BCC|nr:MULTISPECIES: alpha/beta hydrolase [unclassified Pseudodesulfovibrio]MCJ2165247.1 alpha/beta hydrolase [Pseudodesulfovibrio sp. S3-i]RWU03298.1 alpha/beta hydrolase [Pseudodesulfovibrio sp. S3]